MTGSSVECATAGHEAERWDRRVAVDIECGKLCFGALTYSGDLEGDDLGVGPFDVDEVAREQGAEPVEDAGSGLEVDWPKMMVGRSPSGVTLWSYQPAMSKLSGTWMLAPALRSSETSNESTRMLGIVISTGRDAGANTSSRDLYTLLLGLTSLRGRQRC